MAASNKVLDDLADILAKAEHEGTPPEEAAIALKIAEKRAAKLGIDLAIARIRRDSRSKEETPTKKSLFISLGGGGFDKYHATLLSYIADVYDVKTLFADRWKRATLYGFESDINLVIALFQTSQGIMAGQAWKDLYVHKVNRDEDGNLRENSRVYRRTFYESFANSMYYRLKKERDRLVDSPEKGYENAAVALYSRKEKVDSYYKSVLEDEGLRIKTTRDTAVKGWSSRAHSRGAEAAQSMKFASDDLSAGTRAGELGS